MKEMLFKDRTAAPLASDSHTIPFAVESLPQEKRGEERGPPGQEGSLSVRADEAGPSNIGAAMKGRQIGSALLSILPTMQPRSYDLGSTLFLPFFTRWKMLLLLKTRRPSVGRLILGQVEGFEIPLDLEDYWSVDNTSLLRDMNTSFLWATVLQWAFYLRLNSVTEIHRRTLREIKVLQSELSSASQHLEELSKVGGKLEEARKLAKEAQAEVSRLRAEVTELEEARRLANKARSDLSKFRAEAIKKIADLNNKLAAESGKSKDH